MNIISGVVLGWLGRRALELGGLVGLLFTLYSGLPPAQQEAIGSILTGGWQDVPVGVIVSLVVYIFSQVMSFRSTVKPQIVTKDGVKVDTAKDLPAAKKGAVEQIAHTAAEKKAASRPTILDRLAGVADWFRK